MSIFFNYILLAILLFPRALSSQANVEGSYVYTPVYKFKWAEGKGGAVLDLYGNRFHIYAFPLDIVGHITIRTGTFTYSDSTFNMHVDTSFGISLNILRLTSLNINCDSSYSGIYNSKNQTIRIEKVELQDSFTFNVDSTAVHVKKVPSIEFQYTIDNALEITLRRYGVTYDWLKECLKQNLTNGLKDCSD